MGTSHRDLLGRDVLASDGAKLGHVADVYVEPETGAPKWLVVTTGLFSTTLSFVPADGAGADDDGRVVVPYTRKQVRRAPHPDADGDLSQADETNLARHYLAAAPTRSVDPTVETDLADMQAPIEAEENDEWLVGPGASDSSMVRAEEELQIESEVRPAQRARLVKRVVTEQVTFTVPVRREVLHLEYEDIAEGEFVPASVIAPFTPVPDQEIVLYAEIVEYEKKIVPKERVRLRKETTEAVLDVRTDLRKEEVDLLEATAEPTLI